MEIASRDFALYCNGKEILGLGKIKGEYDERRQDLLVVTSTGSHKWELTHGQNTMLIVEYTNPTLPKLKINKEAFDDLLNIPVEIYHQNLDRLWKIVDIATLQKHGALLIISSEAENESLRLPELNLQESNP